MYDINNRKKREKSARSEENRKIQVQKIAAHSSMKGQKGSGKEEDIRENEMNKKLQKLQKSVFIDS